MHILAILLLCPLTKVNQYQCQYLKSFFSIPIPIPIPEKSCFQYQYQYLRKWYFQYQYQYRANTSIPDIGIAGVCCTLIKCQAGVPCYIQYTLVSECCVYCYRRFVVFQLCTHVMWINLRGITPAALLKPFLDEST